MAVFFVFYLLVFHHHLQLASSQITGFLFSCDPWGTCPSGLKGPRGANKNQHHDCITDGPIDCDTGTQCDIYCEVDILNCRRRRRRRNLLQVNDEACAGVTINCPSNAICNIYCDYSCQSMIVYATLSTQLNIFNCGDEAEGCNNMIIYCPMLNGISTGGTCNIMGSTANNINGLNIYAQEAFFDADMSSINLVNSPSNNIIHCGLNTSTYSCIIDESLQNNCAGGTGQCSGYRLTTSPTNTPSTTPTSQPTIEPTTNTSIPTQNPTNNPTTTPTTEPTIEPTINPTNNPSNEPSHAPFGNPTISPTTFNPTISPTKYPSFNPTESPTNNPTFNPTLEPTYNPTLEAVVRVSTNIETTSNKDDGDSVSIIDEGGVGIAVGVGVTCICCGVIFFIYHKKKQKEINKLDQRIQSNSYKNTLQHEHNRVVSTESVSAKKIEMMNQQKNDENNNNTGILQRHLSNEVGVADVMMDDIIDHMRTPQGPSDVTNLTMDDNKSVYSEGWQKDIGTGTVPNQDINLAETNEDEDINESYDNQYDFNDEEVMDEDEMEYYDTKGQPKAFV